MAAPTSSLGQPITISPAFSSMVSSVLPPHDATVPRRRYGKQPFMTLVACRRIRGLRISGAGARPAVEPAEAEKGRVSKWDGEEWWEVEGELPASEEEESRLAEALEWLEEEAMQGGEGHGGREAADYNRRAHIFGRSSRVFPAIKARCRSPDARPSSSPDARPSSSSDAATASSSS